MADRVLPVVRKLLVCQDALPVQDEKTNEWRYQLTQPLTVVARPLGVAGIWAVRKLFLYMQVAGAVGKFTLFVRIHSITLDDTGWEVVDKAIPINSDPREIDFGEFDKLDSRDHAFEMTMVPFDAPGNYRFSVWAVDYTDEWDSLQLPGETTDLIVLDKGAML